MAHPPETPKFKLIEPGNDGRILVLRNGCKLVIVKHGNRKTAYIIQKDATLKLADGVFTFSDGKEIKIINGKLMDPTDE